MRVDTCTTLGDASEGEHVHMSTRIETLKTGIRTDIVLPNRQLQSHKK